ncbi:MAG: carboxypeptidase-like regulatory domain-containing protein [Tannerellaceae bacterium]|nr:carboxypeptidase-like regulatory domain-containing protein [Tannerellaceae bacterium]
MKRKLLTLFSLLLCLCTTLSAQQQTIKGTVSDTNNDPVIGATVVLKGTTTGTTTDLDGNYSINASPNDVLVFFLCRYATTGKNCWSKYSY